MLTARGSDRSGCFTKGIGEGPTVATLALPDGADAFPESCDDERAGFTEAPVLPLLAGTGVLEGERRLALGWRAFPLPLPFNLAGFAFLANGD